MRSACLACGGSAGAFSKSNNSTTFDAVLLTFCPPGPLLRDVLAACSFVFLVTVPEQLLKGALIVAKGSYRVFLGPAALLPAEWFESPLFNALNRADVFSLWMAILLVIALPAMAGISRTKATITVGYLWVLWLLEGVFLGGLVRVS